MTTLKRIIRQAIDVHIHIGPEVIPRKYTAESFAVEESGKIGGAVLKNHFYSTQPFINEIKNIKGMKMFGGIVLNNAVGGINAETIYASSLLTNNPIVVWFPTINAENFLSKSEFEIAPEWTRKKNFFARKSKNIKPVKVTDGKILSKKIIEILQMIRKCNAVLATGHISWKESVILVNKAVEMGIKNIVITHPIYQKINMPISVQKMLAQKGCFIEQSYSMYSIDKIPIRKIAEQIKAIGSQNVILSSDVGQTFSPSPSKALLQFSTLLEKEGTSEKELFTMMVTNPKKLLRI